MTTDPPKPRPKPRAIIAHIAGVRLFGDDDMAHIATVADVLDPEPIGAWTDPRAEDLLPETEVIIGHWQCPRLDAAMLDRAPDLGLFAYAAGTVKGIVTDAVFDRGIRVTSGAKANAEPVAEFTLAAILFAGKDVLWRRDRMRDPGLAGVRQHTDVLPGNWDKTIGIVGASMVGRRVIQLLHPFPHLEVALYDPFVTDAQAAQLGVTKLDLDELCAQADVLSIHAPELPETRHMIGAEQLALLRTGATVINTARGSLVDQDALEAELESGRLYAVLDVTDPEPLPDGHVLLSLPTAFLTPHLAGSEGTELARMTDHVVREIRRWSIGDPGNNEIHREHLSRLA
jgi:phosphoglycerate dehydrogenase-like enzyme